MSITSFGPQIGGSGTSHASVGRSDERTLGLSIGKRTLVEQVESRESMSSGTVGRDPAGARGPATHALVQRKLTDQADASSVAPDRVRELAHVGTRGAGGSLPYLDTIQRLFGRHDVGGIRAHSGEVAAASAGAMGAEAFATGDHVAFSRAPDLHTAAHEAAHVVQQRGGVQLKAHVGRVDDEHERHADQVADHVTQGRSAEPLLDRYAAPSNAASSNAAPSNATSSNATPSNAAPSNAATSNAVQRVILTKTGEPFQKFSAVKQQLTVLGKQLEPPQLEHLKRLFDATDCRPTLSEALDIVTRTPGKIDGGDSHAHGIRAGSDSDSEDDEKKTEKKTEKKEKEEEKKKKNKRTEEEASTKESKKRLKMSGEGEHSKDKGKGKDKDHDDGDHRIDDSHEKLESKDHFDSTIGEAVLRALNDSGIKDRGIQCLLIDPAISDLVLLLKYDKKALAYLEEGSVEKPAALVDDERIGWVAYTACYNTAEELFKLLGTGESNGTMTGANRTEIRQQDNKTAKTTIAATIKNLCDQINHVAKGRAIFRIHYGIHGFSIVIRNNQAELLESFAGTTGHSFLKGLEDHPTYSIPQVCAHLTQMVSAKKSERGAAQDKLFGGGVEDSENVWPNIELKWGCDTLISDQKILQQFKRMITDRAKTLRTSSSKK